MHFRQRNILLLVVVVLCMVYSKSSGQGKIPAADSLKTVLAHVTADTQKVNILLGAVPEMPCDDEAKLRYAQQAKDISGRVHYLKGLLQANLLLGNIYFGCLSDYNKAFNFFVTADSLAKNEQDNRSRVLALNYKAAVYQKLGQYNLAIDCYRQVLALNPDQYEEMGALGNLGVEFNSIGDYNKALEYYYSSLRLLDRIQRTKKMNEVQDTIQMAGLLLNIGDVYMELSQPDNAFKKYDSVYKLGLVTDYPMLQVIGMMGMGEVFQTKNAFERSIDCYLQALNKVDDYDFGDKIKILNKLGNAYLGKREPDSAMQFASGALKLAEEKNNEEQLPKVYITLGKVYAEESAYNNAIAYATKALGIAQKTNALNDAKDAWYVLVNTYKQMNQPGKALEAYEHYITIRDSVYNIAKANEITRQELDFTYKQQQLADKQAYDRNLARQRLFIYGGSSLLILLVLLTFFIYRNYNIQKKYNDLLSREKQRHLAHIEAQDTVLSDIAHIQSHRVRGPVATILGLIQIFNRDNPADPVNKEVIEGLAVITERLDDVVKEVIIKENRLKAEQQAKDKQ